MLSSHSHQSTLAQRTGSALAEALHQGRRAELPFANSPARRIADLLIDGVSNEQLPSSIDRTRSRSPQSAVALAINAFLPWQGAADQLPLAGWTGFDAVQFEARCPTGLRGTPPHLDFLALRSEVAVAVSVRCIEYLSRRKTAVAPSYDQLLAITPGLDPWRRQLDQLRRDPQHWRHMDPGALIKYALALGRTFPERPTILLYLYWEPLNADRFAEFCRHRSETARLADEVHDSRVTFKPQSCAAMWQEWASRDAPSWVAAHVARLRARYCVAIPAMTSL